MRTLFDPKPCPNRAQSLPPIEGAIVSGGAARLTESHRSELNRRPLLSLKVAFGGISRRFNDIRRRISAFFGRETVKSHPETVPKACLRIAAGTHSLTNPLVHFRFSPNGQRELERAARRELDAFVYGRPS